MLPDNFGAALTRFMEERGITIEKLAELTELSDRTIRRMKDPKNETYGLNAVVAVCVALHLPGYQCDMMLMLAGYTLKISKRIICIVFFLTSRSRKQYLTATMR